VILSKFFLAGYSVIDGGRGVIRQAILGGGILGIGLSLVGYEVDHIVEPVVVYLVRFIVAYLVSAR